MLLFTGSAGFAGKMPTKPPIVRLKARVPPMSEPTRKSELPPDLPEFIRKHGGYANVTPEGWREWERIKAEWQARNHNPAGALKDQD